MPNMGICYKRKMFAILNTMNGQKSTNNEPKESYQVEIESLPEIRIDGETIDTKPPTKRFTIVKKGPLSKKEKIYFVSALLLIILTGGGLLWWLNSQPLPEAIQIATVKKVEQKYYSLLSGVQIADEAAQKKPVTAVMIENSPDARPQSGLAEAEVVFEAVAEGGITRFIALYQTASPGLIGPVRSLRPYYADWAAGFDPSVAHVGGSPEALSMIRSGNYGVDIDQFFNGSYYWRATDRSAPHNVYTNSEKLAALTASKNKTASTFAFAPRVNEKKVAAPNASLITVDISSGIFNVSYDYESSTNSYNRKQGGVAHTDREKGQISPKVVVVMKTDISLSSDGTHQNITTTGSGPVYIFQNGSVVEGTWSKNSAKDQLYFKDAEGKEVPLVRGQTWVTTIGRDKNVAWQ